MKHQRVLISAKFGNDSFRFVRNSYPNLPAFDCTLEKSGRFIVVKNEAVFVVAIIIEHHFTLRPLIFAPCKKD